MKTGRIPEITRCRLCTVITLFAVILSATPLFAAQPCVSDGRQLEWEETWELLLEESPSIGALKEAVRASRAGLKSAAVASKVTTAVTGTGVKEEADRASSAVRFTVSYSTSLFGRETAQVKSAALLHEESLLSLDKGYLDLYNHAATAYWGAAAARVAVRAAEEELSKRRAFLDDAQLRYEQGLVPELDVLRAKSSLAEAQYLLSTKESQMVNMEAMLKGLAGWKNISPAEGVLEAEPPMHETPPDYGKVCKEHPTICKAELEVERQKALLRLAKKTSAPTLSLSASNSLALDGSYAATYTQDDWYGSATITIPVTDGGAAHWAAEKARAGVASAERALASARAGVMRDLFTAWQDYQSSLTGLASARERFGLLAREREIVLLRYREGLASQIEVLDVQTRYTEANADFIDSKKAVFVACAALAAARAELPVEVDQ